MFKSLEDMQTFGKSQFDAANVSAKAWSNGLQQIASETSDYSKQSFQASSGFFEKLAGVKSLDKAMEVQTEFAKSAYESFLAQTTKMGDLYASIAKNVYKPVEDAFAQAQVAAN